MPQINTEDQATEAAIQAKGLTAPRVTPDHIKAAIKSEHYFTAAEAVIGGSIMDGGTNAFVPDALITLTFCVLVLQNGFTVVGHSACASPENFDAEIGRSIARQNAEREIWPLEGYLLKNELHRKAQFAAEQKTGEGTGLA